MFVALFDIAYSFSFFPAGYLINSVLSFVYNTPLSLMYFWLFSDTFIFIKLLQYENACVSIFVTLFGISIVVKLLQELNAPISMFFTLFDISYSFSFFPAGYLINSVIFFVYNTPLSLKYFLFFSDTFILVKLLQLENAGTAILVTLSGISILIKLLHSSNA